MNSYNEELKKESMNRYYSYDHLDLEGREDCKSYYEVSEEGVYLCSITCNKGIWTNSYIQVEDGEFFLPEAILEQEDKEFLTEISRVEFTKALQLSQASFKTEWIEFKSRAMSLCEGEISCFYPQGVVIKLNEPFYGLADYDQCAKVVPSEQMYPGTPVRFTVDFIDEENYILHLTIRV